MRPCIASLVIVAAVAAWCAEARAGATLLNNLGGPRGYGTSCMPPNDDGSWPADTVGLDLTPAFPHGLHFYAGSYTRGWVNNNGNLSFHAALSTYTPSAFPGAPQPMIAPYWADVDTRNMVTCDAAGYPSGGGYPCGATCSDPQSDGVWWSLTPGQMVVTWDQVGYFLCQLSPVMSFQMILTAQGCTATTPTDAGVTGIDFDIEFRYSQCGWEAGDASGGSGGFCAPATVCTPAQAGFDSGESPDIDYWSLPLSRRSGVSIELCTGSNLDPPQPGVWRFAVRAGTIQCANSGQPCNTGKPGICAPGRIDCNVQGNTTCVPINAPQPSQCNGLDNDCDGKIDDGPCPPLDVCWGAQCQPRCQEGDCPTGQVCDQVCMDPDCVGVTCPAGKHCSHGQCVDACSEVKCPIGQVCRIGTCVSPCAGVTCPMGDVCDSVGLCVPSCACAMCPTGQACQASGECVDAACATVSCPPSQVCQSGQCIDACTGAVCPMGQVCKFGKCVPSPPAPPDAGGVFVPPDASAGDASGGARDAGAGDGGASFGPSKKSTGCGCSVIGGPEGGTALLFAAGVAGALRRRRARRLRARA
jgi:hypothetical protein